MRKSQRATHLQSTSSRLLKKNNNNNKTNKIKNNQSKKNEKVVEHLKNCFAMVRTYMLEDPNLKS